MGPLALLGLLGAAALAGVSTVPVAKEHLEEMVTECIVEVLSNALLKPDAPPINPDCREILRKGGGNNRERSENNQLEVRHSEDTAETEKYLPGSLEEESRQAEEETKESMNRSEEEKLAEEQDKSKEEEDGHQAAAEEERLHREGKKHYQEIREEEEEKSYQSEEESKASKRLAKQVELAVLNKKSSGDLSTEQLPAGSKQHPTRHWHSEEGRQSPYKRVPEGEGGEAEEERSEKSQQESQEGDFSQEQERAESEEREETQEEKPPYSPRSYGKHRGGDSSEEKRGHGGEKEESSREETHPWGKRNHHQKHGETSQQQQREEKSRYHGRHGSEEEEEEKRTAGQGREEYRERWQQSEESSEEEEEKSHQHREESDEQWQEERRHRDGVRQAGRRRSQGRTRLEGASEEGLDRGLGGGSKEQRQGGRSSRWGGQGEGPQAAYAGERRGQPRTHHGPGDGAEQLRDLRNGEEEEEEEEEEEGVAKQHQSSDQVEDEEEDVEEGRHAEREGSRSGFPAEKEKRRAAAYSQFYPLLWWPSRHLEKRDGAGEQRLGDKEEGSPSLAEKSLLPEYSDYEWWEKQQLLGKLQQGRPQQDSPGTASRAQGERQQHKVQQLAQLLSYRKKAAEFPQLYSSREDTKRRQAGRSDRSLSQSPLTEEEDKELENLAAMELELQKIAQKFKDSRRG